MRTVNHLPVDAQFMFQSIYGNYHYRSKNRCYVSRLRNIKGHLFIVYDSYTTDEYDNLYGNLDYSVNK